MTSDQVRTVLLDALHRIAPDVDIAELDPTQDLRAQADLDSVDIVSLAVHIHEELGVDVPEVDYAALRTIDGAVTYLSGRLERT